jgi:hypothetical protein
MDKENQASGLNLRLPETSFEKSLKEAQREGRLETKLAQDDFFHYDFFQKKNFTAEKVPKKFYKKNIEVNTRRLICKTHINGGRSFGFGKLRITNEGIYQTETPGSKEKLCYKF